MKNFSAIKNIIKLFLIKSRNILLRDIFTLNSYKLIKDIFLIYIKATIRVLIIGVIGISFINTFSYAAELTLEEYVRKPFGNVIFLRHALAPGFDAKGEPDKFKIDDCSTQRNLNAVGIEQAINLGKLFTQSGLKFNKIYSSQWCRCLETARLLDMGEVITEPSLNSGFRGIFNKEISLAKLRKLLDELKNKNGLFLMITHYGTITAMTEIFVDSGGAVAYNVKTKSSIKILLK